MEKKTTIREWIEDIYYNFLTTPYVTDFHYQGQWIYYLFSVASQDHTKMFQRLLIICDVSYILSL